MQIVFVMTFISDCLKHQGSPLPSLRHSTFSSLNFHWVALLLPLATRGSLQTLRFSSKLGTYSCSASWTTVVIALVAEMVRGCSLWSMLLLPIYGSLQTVSDLSFSRLFSELLSTFLLFSPFLSQASEETSIFDTDCVVFYKAFYWEGSINENSSKEIMEEKISKNCTVRGPGNRYLSLFLIASECWHLKLLLNTIIEACIHVGRTLKGVQTLIASFLRSLPPYPPPPQKRKNLHKKWLELRGWEVSPVCRIWNWSL